MPNPATNLQAQVLGSQIGVSWQLPAEIITADAMFVDIATESGFVNYVQQAQVNLLTTQFASINLQAGIYWIRVNIHYPGFGTPQFGPLDRGWFPSQHVMAVVGNPGPLPTGTPAKNLHWNAAAQYNLTWTPGSGSAPITRVACDISSFPNFGDILASPFIPTDLGGGVTILGLPFAVDVPLVYNSHIGIHGLPLGQSFYVRVNTLFDNQVWMPSETLHFNTDGSVTPIGGGGTSFPWIPVMLVAGTVILFAASEDNKQES